MDMGIAAELGINAAAFLAGLSGGVCNVAFFRSASPRDMFGTILGGALMGNYLMLPAVHYLSFDPNASAFIVGAAAMPILQKIVDRARSMPSTSESKP